MAVGQQVYSNRYEIVRGIARGGMSEVYLARDRHLDRPVALKVLTSELSRDPTFVERFRREAQAAANLSHPNIVAVYDWGQEDGTYFIVMEYIDGHSLRDVLRNSGTVEPIRAAGIAAEVAAGLSFAHKAGVVHRDVKPGNVLIETSGQVKVTDFGVARADANEGLTQTGSVMGTATYFSPEQAQGLPVDGRSDVYSLGVLLYEMVSGKPPFVGENPVSVAYQHVREPVPPLHDRVPDVPPALDRIVMTTLDKDPNRRYQSADDLRADLLRFRRGRPIVGGPLTAQITEVPSAGATQVHVPVAGASVPVTSIDHKRRNPWGIAAIALLLLVVIGAIAFLLTREVSSAEGNGGGRALVPSVVTDPPSVPLAQARATLEARGFVVRVDQIPREDLPPGIVVSQTPPARTSLPKGEEVRLGVSSGPGEVQVPDVSGKSQATATTFLEALGFKVSVSQEPSSANDPGTVIRTAPAAGSIVGRGSKVQVVISSGAPSVVVPNVVNQAESAGANLLGQAGFQVNTTRETSDSVAAGNVIRTAPAAGTQAIEGSTVQMVVSTGPSQVSVPNVVGSSQSSAEQTITTAGLAITVQSTPSTPDQKGIVSGQSPGSGSKVAAGSGVTIVVGDGTLPAAP